MAINWWESVCRAPNATRIADVRLYTRQAVRGSESPIDSYFARAEALLRAGTPTYLQSNPLIAPLFLVGIASATENYFRELFSQLLEVCPISQARSASRDIKLGSVIWFKTGKIERGAFEGFSFAAADNIIDTSRKFFDHAITERSDCFALLQEFDKLCEVRHSIVHSSCVFSGKNSLKLQLPPTDEDTLVFVDFDRFQEAAAICTSLVSAANIEYFSIMAKRWKNDWPRKVPSWNTRLQNAMFKRLWGIFYSDRDNISGIIPTVLGRDACKTEILTSV